MRVNRKKLVIAMLDKDINAIQLAEASNLSRITISNIKCGKSCSRDTLNKISKALGVEPEEIIE